MSTSTAAAPTGTAHLARLRMLADETDARVAALVRGLSPAQRLWRPAPDRWGVADCFEHLIATGAAYYPRVAAALAAAPAGDADARARHAAAPYRPTWFGGLFVRMTGPGGRAIRSPRPFVPPPAAADAHARFLAQQATLRALLGDAEGRDLRGIVIRSPVSRLLALRLGECLEMLVVHEQRHLLQAERVRAEPGFPTA